MEGTDLPQIEIPCHRADPGLHLLGRLIREGHAENILRIDAEIAHKIDIAARQCPRLTGTGTCNHADRAFRGLNGEALLGVQFSLLQSGKFL